MNILDRGLWDKLVNQEKQEYFYLLGYPLLYKKTPLRYYETQSQEDTRLSVMSGLGSNPAKRQIA